MYKFPFLYSLFLFTLGIISSCSTTPKLKTVETSMHELNAQTVSSTDSSVIKTISPYKTEMDKTMNEVLVVSKQPILKGVPESSLGDFVSDLILKKTNDKYKPQDNQPALICLLNNGSFRGQLPKGNITRGNAYELMPFENSIVVLTLTGANTKHLFEYLIDNKGEPFAGATVKSKNGKISELKINGTDFDQNKNYKITTSDYLAAGGDKFDFFKNPVKTDTLNYKIRDAIIDYMIEKNKKGDTLNVSIDGRIQYE